MNQPQVAIYHPGTLLSVGSHQARIIKYLTSGGFAQVYTAEISPIDPFINSSIVCLKRVIVPDKPSLNTLRAEVDAMKLLRNNTHVVSYIDSHAAKFDTNIGSYEVFLLMEYCDRGGLIDFMNTRLQNRLHENEILDIMSQVSQGVAAMHALQPPLLHRDIKIENVLLTSRGHYKLCDFGSVCGIIRPPTNPQEFTYVQHDIMKNTTAQYRSPEMINLGKGLPINEKSDIWALGVFLYKLCYYTTPFEKTGENAILHASFQFPNFPHYSDRMKSLIRITLNVQPSQRPNIYQLLEEVSKIQNVPCPIPDFYLQRKLAQAQAQTQAQDVVMNVPIPSYPVAIPAITNNNGSYNYNMSIASATINPQNANNNNTNNNPYTVASNNVTGILQSINAPLLNVPLQPNRPISSQKKHIQKSQTMPMPSMDANLKKSTCQLGHTTLSIPNKNNDVIQKRASVSSSRSSPLLQERIISTDMSFSSDDDKDDDSSIHTDEQNVKIDTQPLTHTISKTKSLFDNNDNVEHGRSLNKHATKREKHRSLPPLQRNTLKNNFDQMYDDTTQSNSKSSTPEKSILSNQETKEQIKKKMLEKLQRVKSITASTPTLPTTSNDKEVAQKKKQNQLFL
ncbi:serine/threonine protein kinase ARK1 NDAI_0G00640 [Naumovozyma dairenensis CBS 421]|uniref:non-specific serine/threonine protein kinase n=1 Tax=Naumovozyma dairenensis (strain ATCC 10597 / BCRC 20456 / CBS 421 / NBRC 0211 / NRRL Y-12639) TaxID=1071378 RepID=G0WDH9_NAUDC|nr:hypothetical protein NDAI_0G00640 [Naumovozyma dairenensis CBS 421]CCD25840.2 hypothetical protein NDAI_0G00640 [Naumovozyma dairenensis CBS 421]